MAALAQSLQFFSGLNFTSYYNYIVGYISNSSSFDYTKCKFSFFMNIFINININIKNKTLT